MHDTSGAAIPGATVNVQNTDTNIRHTLATNATGRFVVTQLQPGTCTAIVEHPGFQKVVEAHFQLTVSQVVTLDIGLTIGRVDQVVNVTA